jgi:hypothetical protein
VKYEVKAGRPVEGKIIVVVIDSDKKEGFSFKKFFGRFLAGFLIVVVVFAPITYGMATGDYSIAKSIAEYGKEIIVEVAAKIATKSKE